MESNGGRGALPRKCKLIRTSDRPADPALGRAERKAVEGRGGGEGVRVGKGTEERACSARCKPAAGRRGRGGSAKGPEGVAATHFRTDGRRMRSAASPPQRCEEKRPSRPSVPASPGGENGDSTVHSVLLHFFRAARGRQRKRPIPSVSERYATFVRSGSAAGEHTESPSGGLLFFSFWPPALRTSRRHRIGWTCSELRAPRFAPAGLLLLSPRSAALCRSASGGSPRPAHAPVWGRAGAQGGTEKVSRLTPRSRRVLVGMEQERMEKTSKK